MNSVLDRLSFKKNGGYMLLSASLLSIATAASAQVPVAKDTGATAPADEGDAGNAITVVARKQAENPQQVPIPITVITASELTRQNLTNFTNFQAKFPAFSVYLTNPKQLNLGIRGIGNNGFNTDGIDGSVGVFVDGVYTGRQGMVSNDFNDIADVELLRGPQGTLFGKNTTAGAVIINTLKPANEWGLSGETSIGNFHFHEFKGSITGPIIKDKLAFRLSGFYSDRDGTYYNLYNGGRQNARQGSGLRAQILVTPTDNLSIRLIGTHARQEFNTISPVAISIYNPAALQKRMADAGYTLNVSNAEDRLLNINSPLNAQTEMDNGSAEINLDLGSAGTLTSLTAYQYWSCFTNNDNDFTQLDAVRDYGSCNREDQWSQEVRWSSKRGEMIEATLGGFLSRQRLKVDSRIQFGSQYNIFAANPSATAFPTLGGRTWVQGAYASQLTGTGFRSVATFRTNTDALFGNISIRPDAERRLSIDLGLRYTWERRSQFYDGWVEFNPGNLSVAQLRALSSSGANAQLGTVNERLADKALSGEAGVNYKVTPDIFLYAKYARGNKSAGFNLLPYNSSNPDSGVNSAIALGAKQTVAGEKADSFEVGIKSSFWDRKVQFNLTGFHTVVQNYQANQAVGQGSTALRFLANVGSLTSDGVEAELETWLARGLHTKGFIGYNHAYYSYFPNSACPATDTVNLTCNLTGRQVAWAPKWTADVTVDYTHPISETADVYGLFDVNWRSKQNYTIILDPTAEAKGYALASLRVGMQLDHGKYDVQFWVENLFDKAYYANLLGLTRGTGVVQGYPGNPRTMGLTARVKM